MFEAGFPAGEHQDLDRAREAAFAFVRKAAQNAVGGATAASRPPAQMVALHVWSLTHGIANLFISHVDDNRRLLPLLPGELREAGLMIYLQSLGPLLAFQRTQT